MEIKELGKYGIQESEVQFYLDKYQKDESFIVVTGLFSAGKTCFINALLGREDFLPHANGECTPIIIDLVQSTETDMTIRYMDGKEDIEPMINDNINKYATYTKDYDKKILSMGIPLEKLFLGERVHIIDTPGTNTVQKEHEDITNYMVKKADLVLYILNKVVADTDITRVKKIMKYTNNIVFITTHMDEKDKSGQAFTEAKIQELTDIVKDELARKLDICREDILLYPIGSKEAFTNSGKVDVIRKFLQEYVQQSSLEKKRKKVISQLNVLFEERIEEITKERAWLCINSKLAIDEIEKKKKDYLINKEKTEEKQRLNIQNLEQRLRNDQINLTQELRELFHREQAKILQELLKKPDITEQDTVDCISQSNSYLGEQVANLVKCSVTEILGFTYKDLNNDITELLGSIGIHIKNSIPTPSVENVSNHKLFAEIQYTKDQLELYSSQLKELSETTSNNSDEQRLKTNIEELEKQRIEYNKKLTLLGEYYPEYERVIDESGKGAGKVAGRVLGEIADIALIFWNPAGAAEEVAKGSSKGLKMVDSIKDVIKSTQLISQSAQQVFKEVKSSENLVKIGNAVKKVDRTRREIKEVVDTQSSDNSISSFLDMLSLGYWGEKIGGGIGNAIKPTKTLLIENEEYKKQYEEAKNSITAEKLALKDEINLIQQKMMESDDNIGRTLRLKKELEQKQKELADKVILLEEKNLSFQRNSGREYVEKYYTDQIGGIVKEETEKCCQMADMIFDTLQVKLIERISVDFELKLADIDAIIAKLNEEGQELDNEILQLDSALEKLSSHKLWINEWVG
jgi:hypothetical protein